MNVGICYAEVERQFWVRIDVPEGSSVEEVIKLSGVLGEFPAIDLGASRVGIFGKFTKLDVVVKEGDRIEIYRPITADPKQVKRRRITQE